MKIKIEHAFMDKHTKRVYAAGDVVEFADERAKEILADDRKLASVFEENTKTEEAEKPVKRRMKKSAKTKE